MKTKQYISAQLNVVSIKNDIVTTSVKFEGSYGENIGEGDVIESDAPSRRNRNDYDF